MIYLASSVSSALNSHNLLLSSCWNKDSAMASVGGGGVLHRGHRLGARLGVGLGDLPNHQTIHGAWGHDLVLLPVNNHCLGLET